MPKSCINWEHFLSWLGEQEGDDRERNKEPSKNEVDLNELSPEERNEDDNDVDEDKNECVKNDLVNADKEEDQIPDNLEFDDADVEDQEEVGKFCFDCALLFYSFYHF